MMKHFLYLALGEGRHKSESVCSIRSLMKSLRENTDEYVIHVVTDDIQFYNQINNNGIVIDCISEEIVNLWSKNKRYFPRCKIECMKYFFEKYKSDLVFIDTDTIILNDISYVFHLLDHNVFMMHSACASIRTALDIIGDINIGDHNNDSITRFYFYKNLVDNNEIFMKQYPINGEFIPYNSGIIGMKYEQNHILNDILLLSDYIMEHYSYWCAEEFAFSYMFQRVGTILTMDQDVFHYHAEKFACSLATYVMGYLDEYSTIELNEIMKASHITDLSKFELKLEDIPDFIRFLFVHNFLKMDDKEKSRSLEESNSYISPQNKYYSRNNSLNVYKKYYKRFLETQ